MKLEFDKDALLEIAETPLKRKTGARGLRAIMENIMMDTMFTVPSDKTSKECRNTKEADLGVEEPKYNRESEERKSFLTLRGGSVWSTILPAVSNEEELNWTTRQEVSLWLP